MTLKKFIAMIIGIVALLVLIVSGFAVFITLADWQNITTEESLWALAISVPIFTLTLYFMVKHIKYNEWLSDLLSIITPPW